MNQNKEPLFFYGHKKRPNDISQRHVFSQFYPCRFTDEDGYEYNCAEQFMMAQKAVLFLDKSLVNQQILDQIMEASDPALIKRLGRKIRGFSDEVWDQYKEDVVFNGNYFKFSQNTELKKILLATGDRELCEASPDDRVWGIGVDENMAKITDRTKWGKNYWRGSNLLGIALMQVRDELKK